MLAFNGATIWLKLNTVGETFVKKPRDFTGKNNVTLQNLLVSKLPAFNNIFSHHSVKKTGACNLKVFSQHPSCQ